MEMKQLALVVLSGVLTGHAPAQVIFSDDFDDQSNTGWSYFNRNGAEEIDDAVWVETGGRLEQQTPDYDFPRDNNVNDPVLGSIALAPQSVGGHYSLSAEFTSLEPGNGFQDQDFVFGYIDADNFFIMESIPSGLNVFNVVDGDRVTIGTAGIAFSHDATTVVLEHNAETGEIIITYGDAEPTIYQDPVFIREGVHRVGVGSNNDAFAIDDFTITQIAGGVVVEPTITAFQRDPESGEVTLSWTSEADVLYAVSRSTNLELWDEIEDSLVGEADTTTFLDNPADDTAFYRVQRLGNSP